MTNIQELAMIYHGPNGLTLDLTLLIGVGKKKEFVKSVIDPDLSNRNVYKDVYRRTILLYFQGNTITVPVKNVIIRDNMINEILDIRFGNGEPQTEQAGGKPV